MSQNPLLSTDHKELNGIEKIAGPTRVLGEADSV